MVQNVDGRLIVAHFLRWEIAQAETNPEAYAAKGKVLFGRSVPAEWVGQVVSVFSLQSDEGRLYLDAAHIGELVSVSPLVLNLGWDGRDRREVIVPSATWVALTDEKVRRLEGEDLAKRQASPQGS